MGKKIAILAITFAIVAFTQPAYAQQVGKVYRIGYLQQRAAPPSSPQNKAFHRGLRDLGYAEGQNIRILYRSADGRPDRFPALVTDLIERKVYLIVTVGGVPTRAVMKASRTIPIVIAVATPD